MVPKDKVTEALDALFKQWQGVGERIREVVAPALKQEEQFKKSLQPIIEAQQALQKTLEPFCAEQERWTKLVKPIEIPEYVLTDLTSLTTQALELKKSIEEFISPAFEQLQSRFRELPARTKEAFLLLGNYCWYPDLNMTPSESEDLRLALSEGNVEEAEGALVEWFESRIDEIEKSIIERFPRRQKLIRAAFNAHRRKEYDLSIPVLLAQTDGICKEVTERYFFKEHKGKPQTAIYVKQFASDSYLAALLSPLSERLPIGKYVRKRQGKWSSKLNRHKVLHGTSLDYGTRINGLKAISLINYVVHALKNLSR